MNISTYYYCPIKKISADEKAVVREIDRIIQRLPDSGYRPVTEILKRDRVINHKRVLSIMGKYDLLCRKQRKFKAVTTDSKHKFRKYPNIISDKITTDINQIIVGDITAFNIRGKDHYLALLMDLHNREAIGIAISDKNDTALVLAALKMAQRVRPSLKNCIHHTDADVRYCSDEYIRQLKAAEMKISMCVGNVYENAHAESLNKTIKRQEINMSEYESKEEAAASIFKFINTYNMYRPHSALNGMTPVEFKSAKKELTD